jgi:hypothetical protein
MQDTRILTPGESLSTLAGQHSSRWEGAFRLLLTAGEKLKEIRSGRIQEPVDLESIRSRGREPTAQFPGPKIKFLQSGRDLPAKVSEGVNMCSRGGGQID